MATHSSILAWRIPWTEEPGSPWCCRQSDTTEQWTLLLVENSKELPQKIKNRITVWSCNLTSGYISKGNVVYTIKELPVLPCSVQCQPWQIKHGSNLSAYQWRYICVCMCVCIYIYIQIYIYIYACVYVCVCVCVYVYIYIYIYIHTIEYYSALKKKEILPCAIIWVNLQDIRLSEIFQTQNDKYCMVLYVESKVEPVEAESVVVVARGWGGRGNGRSWSKYTSFSVLKWMSSGDLI